MYKVTVLTVRHIRLHEIEQSQVAGDLLDDLQEEEKGFNRLDCSMFSMLFALQGEEPDQRLILILPVSKMTAEVVMLLNGLNICKDPSNAKGTASSVKLGNEINLNQYDRYSGIVDWDIGQGARGVPAPLRQFVVPLEVVPNLEWE